jgi:diketogulonate reductase-like aldo/keto reductase
MDYPSMMTDNNTTRREFLLLMSALGISGCDPAELIAQEQMPSRQIPGTNESLPIIGLGSSKPVSQIAERGTEHIAAVLRELVAKGGSVVDTWPRNPANDEAFGRIISEPDLGQSLFVASKIDKVGKDAGIQQFRETQRLYQREVLDLLQIFRLTDVETQWPTLMDCKESEVVRYIGVTVANESLYEPLERFLQRENPDFVQINYSITEREAEERMLPMCQDQGIAVIINHEWRLFPTPRPTSLTRVGRRVRLRKLGTILIEIHPAAPGDYMRPDRNQQSRAHGRKCSSHFRTDAR